jgi:hypothetical protein
LQTNIQHGDSFQRSGLLDALLDSQRDLECFSVASDFCLCPLISVLGPVFYFSLSTFYFRSGALIKLAFHAKAEYSCVNFTQRPQSPPTGDLPALDIDRIHRKWE